MDATDRDRVTEAADTADRLLAVNPVENSVYLGERLRRRDILPLRFYFEIREEDLQVVISNVVRSPT
jgi:hypothetical protein